MLKISKSESESRKEVMNLPGYKLHELSGKELGTWSVWVSGNWRITFQFKNEDAYVVDYRDYH